jgi:hypothetical protein
MELATNRCIYTKKPLNDDVPANDLTRSVEHIIPYAIGGSDAFTTADVSKKSNNDLGSTVDADFTNLLPIAIKRHQLKIKSQGGKIPDIIFNGTTEFDGRARIVIHPDQTYDFELVTKVVKDSKSQAVEVAGGRDEVEKMIGNLMRGWAKRGESYRSKGGVEINSVEKAMETADIKLMNGANFNVEFFDRNVWMRGIFKIALGLGHKLMGNEWAFGEAAEQMRNFVMNPDAKREDIKLRGVIDGEWDRKIRLVFGKNRMTRDSMVHAVGIVPSGIKQDVWMGISLFGGNGVPEALFNLGPSAGSLTPVNETLHRDTILGFYIDPRTRRCSPFTLADVDARIARFG